MFDLTSLRTFIRAAETRNFTTVAAERNTVQSAVSAQIQKLEEAVGKRLLDRGRGRAMSLTPEGAAFLVYARRIVGLSEEALETVRTSHAREILRLGTTVTLAMSVVSDALSAFAKLRPDVQIQIQCDRSDALLSRLDAGDIDIAFMMDQGRAPGRGFVRSFPLDWVMGDGFRLPREAPIPLAFLTDGRDLRRYALRALDAVGRKGQVTHLSPHPIGVRAFVQAGLALTVMPRPTVWAPLRPAAPEFDLPPLAPVALAIYTGADGAPEPAIALLQSIENTLSLTSG